MYKLTIKSKIQYNDEISYIFDDFADMMTFIEISLKKAEHPVKVTIELIEKEGEQNAEII